MRWRCSISPRRSNTKSRSRRFRQCPASRSSPDWLIAGDRDDPILIVSKTIVLEWATVRALILLRLGPNRVPSPADIEGARVNFARLMPSTAERVVTFWKSRQAA